MKIVTLNTWGGRLGFAVSETFFKKYQDVDVFCLQEIWQTDNLSLVERWDEHSIDPELFQRIQSVLPEHQGYFRPQYRGIYGLAIFVRKTYPVVSEGDIYVFREPGFENPKAIGNHGRNIQHLTLQVGADQLTVINFHGLWNGEGKGDSDDRILQSRKIVNFVKELPHPYVLVGDFNLNPETTSLKILEEAFERNLISDFEVSSTRSSLYTKPGKFADYILTSKGIEVLKFAVLPEEVSDHLALAVEISSARPLN